MPGQTLAQMVRAKYPGQYDDLNDQQLEAAIDKKYPGQYDDLPRTKAEQQRAATPAQPQMPNAMGFAPNDVTEAWKGAVKGLGNSFVGLGEAMHSIPGVSAVVDKLYRTPGVSQAAFPDARARVQPTNDAQRVGFGLEQLGEFFLPTGEAGALAKLASPKTIKAGAEIFKSGALTGAQGGSGGDMATSAALAGIVPGAGAVRTTAQKLEQAAPGMVQAAIKPTISALRKVSGSGGLDAKAKALVQFIIDKRITTAAQAREIFQQAESELGRLIKGVPSDAPTRTMRYLGALERSAARQGLPASDVAQIRNAAAEVLNGPMGEDVVRMVPKPHPTLVDASGKPLMVLEPETTRALRASMPADEALDSARASSRWSTRKQWGEQKGAAMEAQKTVERAQRDAVKVAQPEARDLLKTEGLALQSEAALDRMAQRTANRDVVGLPAHVMASGGHPLLAFAANLLRNNQLKAGIYADRLAKAIKNGNVPEVAGYLKRLGVAEVSQLMTRQPATAQ